MADNLSMMSKQRVTNDNIVLPAASDPRVLLASIAPISTHCESCGAEQVFGCEELMMEIA